MGHLQKDVPGSGPYACPRRWAGRFSHFADVEVIIWRYFSNFGHQKVVIGLESAEAWRTVSWIALLTFHTIIRLLLAECGRGRLAIYTCFYKHDRISWAGWKSEHMTGEITYQGWSKRMHTDHVFSVLSLSFDVHFSVIWSSTGFYGYYHRLLECIWAADITQWKSFIH